MRRMLQLLASMFSAAKWVLKRTAQGTAWVLEAPFQLLGALFSGGGIGSHEPDERDVAREAAQQAQAEQRQADGRAQFDVVAQAVMRIVKALRDSQQPNREDEAALVPSQIKHLYGLSKPELEILGAASLTGLRARRAFAENGAVPEGCRTAEQVARDLKVQPVAENEHRLRTLTSKLRALKFGTGNPAAQNVSVGTIVRKYTETT